MSNKSVLMVIDSLANGGAQKQFSILAAGLAASGVKVYVTFYKTHSLYFEPYITANGGICLPYPRKMQGSKLRFVWFLRKIVRSKNIGTIVSYLDTPAIYCSLALIGIFDTKYIMCKRSASRSLNVSFVKKFLNRFAILSATKVVANSYAEANFLKENLNNDNAKILTIWNGYVSSHYPVKSLFSFNMKILVVARVNEAKNVLETIKALKLLNTSKNQKITLHWAGRFDCSQAYKDDIDDCLRVAELADNWCWLGHTDNITNQFSDYDALLLPSVYEGLSNALCEAMLYGLPVIATDVSDNALLIGKDERGILAENTDAESIASALHKFYQLSYEERELIAKKAKKFVTDKLSIEELINRYLQLV